MAREDLDMDEKIRVTLESLRSRGFIARYAENRQVAKEMIVDMAQENWIVGNGDSATVRSIGVLQDLQDRGHYILNPFIWVKIMRDFITKQFVSMFFIGIKFFFLQIIISILKIYHPIIITKFLSIE